MDPSLLQLMEELLQSIEQRDAGDPDAPAWEAGIRIQRLKGELSRRIAMAAARGGGRGAASEAPAVPDEVYVARPDNTWWSVAGHRGAMDLQVATPARHLPGEGRRRD